jgi:hypothetical protein
VLLRFLGSSLSRILNFTSFLLFPFPPRRCPLSRFTTLDFVCFASFSLFGFSLRRSLSLEPFFFLLGLELGKNSSAAHSCGGLFVRGGCRFSFPSFLLSHDFGQDGRGSPTSRRLFCRHELLDSCFGYTILACLRTCT